MKQKSKSNSASCSGNNPAERLPLPAYVTGKMTWLDGGKLFYALFISFSNSKKDILIHHMRGSNFLVSKD